ncbi:YfcC family protein [Pseudobacillus badius]|uniref:YfcC family protein n=1 Tax=Bacillus badius TaxID=1455 RepID=UPI000597478D|nr:YfcC family protein [Bacillus badius]KIL73993.1 Arginine/ornithine antiporter ArcD [Bacillus badius]UAT32849.1 YfcC family protein [Bacillus badius]GLY11854.1 C4-dicarboxylate ABC transporter [Bacillus badius]
MSKLETKVDMRSTKEPKGINVYVLIFCLIVLSSVLTYIIPAGEFQREEVNGRSVIQPGTFQYADEHPIGFLDIFSSVHSGMMQGSSIIFFVLIVGGTFGILSATGALDSFISMLSVKMVNREKLIIPVLMLFFACAGSLMGMSDETIVYVGILVPLAVALGFDAMTGFAIVILGASVGFSSAVMNPFTVGIAQEIAELPMFSGIIFRVVTFVVLYLAAVLYVYRYASKVKDNPSLGFYGNFQPGNKEALAGANIKMSMRHKLVMVTFLLNFIVLMYGVMKLGWYITEIAGLFLLFGIIMGLVGKLAPSHIANSFIRGAGDLIGGALIIGLAQSILVIFNDAGLIDTILYHTARLLDVIPPALNAVGMFIFQLFLNFLVPSGSGQAALTMPIMAPLSDMIGVTRQTAVLAYQFGDGMSNIIFPTVGFLMAGLSIAGIPWGKWIKWIFPFMLIQVTVAVVALVIAQLIQYGPF